MHFSKSKKSTSILATAFTFVTLIAVLIRAIIPQGFMLENARTNGNSVQIVLCTAQGKVTAFLSEDGKIVEQQAQNGSHKNGESNSGDDCAYANALTAIAALETNIIALPVTYAKPTITNIAPIPMIGAGLAAPPPPKTGPPITLA